MGVFTTPSPPAGFNLTAQFHSTARLPRKAGLFGRCRRLCMDAGGPFSGEMGPQSLHPATTVPIRVREAIARTKARLRRS